MLVLLLIGSGCINTECTPGNLSVNETPATILYYKNGNLSIPINVLQIEVKDPGNFTANVTSVITILLGDQRTGVLLENGWNITSVSGVNDKHDPNRTHIEVEFRKEGLSFFIGVDENERRTLEGRCGAKQWVTDRISGPLPEDYHQWKWFDEGSLITYYVIDERNERVVMIYNKTTIFYLYPSYAIIDMTGILD